MKTTVKILLIFTIIIAIPFILILVNRIKGYYLAKSYPELGQVVESKSFMIIELPINGQTLEYFNTEDNPDIAKDADPAFKGLEPAHAWPKRGGYVRFDTVHNQFLVCTNEYISSKRGSEGLPDEQKNVIYFNEQGQTTGRASNLYTFKEDWLQNSIVLLDYIPNFPQWKIKKAPLYLKHFEIGKLETNWLNPLRGMGSPNGSGPAPAWSGIAYFDLHINGEKLSFKTPSTKDGFMFLDANDVEADLSYCKLPNSFKRPTPAFLIQQPRFGKGRVFLIKSKAERK